jgi:H+-transporting ATPase
MTLDLETDPSVGLTQKEVNQRISKYGYNEIEEIRQNRIIAFLKKFWGLTAWMLEFIIFLSWILGKYSDVYIIISLLLLNGILGFFEEQKATSAVEFLKERLRVNARVLRDGVWSIVTSPELVPGDIIRVRSGDFVPADVKIITAGAELEVDQSTLTGESLPILEKLGEILYSGSIIRKGEANGVVISTGPRTFFGKTAQLVQMAKPRLHIDEVISSVVKLSLLIVGLLISLAFLFSFLKGIDVIALLPLATALLVSAIPVALPAMFTITMAFGSKELAKKGVLVTSRVFAFLCVNCIYLANSHY